VRRTFVENGGWCGDSCGGEGEDGEGLHGCGGGEVG